MIVYLFDGSFEGFSTCIYYSYYNKLKPDAFISEEDFTYNFTYETLEIKTEYDKYDRVYNSLQDKLTYESLSRIYHLFLSCDDKNHIVLYNYIKLCFKFHKQVDLHLNNDTILLAHRLAKRVSFEAHRFTGFIRFTEVSKDLFYSKIAPDNNILSLILKHFVNRFSNLQFIIHDEKRELAIIYNGNDAIITKLNLASVPSIKQGNYEKLWKSYFNSATISERENRRLQRGFMPKRYWNNLTEI
ncbi:TIGR03915 family putative DNA repair protein [Clostridium cavendishii]|nr:TIGR03915 family putative DNA repair protein [Clostridium cavendishii]